MSFKNIPQAVRTFSIIEADGLGELPPPPAERATRQRASPRLPVLATLAVVLLLVLSGGGIWLLRDHGQPSQQSVSSAASKPAVAEGQATAVAGELKPTAPSAAAAAVDAARAADGVYAGPICLAATETLPGTCFPVEATLRQGSFSGQWPGRGPIVSWHLAGDVSASGHVTIRAHGEKADGTEFGRADFSGALAAGSVDATGEFGNGRKATLNWRKREESQTEAPPKPSAAIPPAIPNPPATAAVISAATESPNPSIEGVYAGQVCFGPGPAQAAACFRAKATLRQGKLVGAWPGRDPGVTMHLEGEVLASGSVSIRMHADDANGRRRATVNLDGTLRDGKLDANGAFLNGRSASLNWTKI